MGPAVNSNLTLKAEDPTTFKLLGFRMGPAVNSKQTLKSEGPPTF